MSTILDGVDEFTDRWAGRQFARLHGPSFRYVTDRAIWRRWDRARWVAVSPVELMRAAKQVVDDVIVNALGEPEQRRREMIKWAYRASNERRLNAMVALAATEEALWARSADFDVNSGLLNVRNGTVDLRTGLLLPHDPRNLITKLSPVVYDPTAEAPRFDRFLDELFPDGADLRGFVQRAAGYSATGHTMEHCFFLCHGSGANGKSRLVGAISDALGDYSTAAQVETFVGKRGSGASASPDLAALPGARMVHAGEIDSEARLSESFVKSLTGDDPVVCRGLHESLFTFRPQFTLWLHTNHRPAIRGLDVGIWRRVRLIPFTASFVGQPERDLDVKLRGELSGILRWIVEGAVLWYANGLGAARAVSDATNEYRVESDDFAAFFATEAELRANASATRGELSAAYKAWAAASGETLRSETDLYRAAELLPGVHRSKTTGVRGFRGLALKRDGQS